jgi:hypothetical protein
VLALREHLAVASEEAAGLAELLLAVADGRRVEQRVVRERRLAEGDAEKELDALAAQGRVVRLREQRAAAQVGVDRVASLRLGLRAARKGVRVVLLDAEVVERGGADVGRDAVGVKRGELAQTVVAFRGERKLEARGAGVFRIGRLRDERGVVGLRGRVASERTGALGEAVVKLVRRDRLLAFERAILDLGGLVVAFVEESVGHREPVGRQHRQRGEENC